MTFQFDADVFPGGAVGEGDVVVGYVVEEVNFRFVEKEAGTNGVDRSITPAFVKETAVLVEGFEKVDVGFAAEPV